ncbi:MAG: hypothetical protein ACO32I_02100 [Candidatus Limnocylindrus sp.]
MNPLLNTAQAHLDMQNRVAETVKQNLSVQGTHRSLEVQSVSFTGTRLPMDYKAQRDVKDKGGTWGQNIKATVALKDNKTGKVIDKQEVTVGVLPVITKRYSYLVGGREYQVQSQFRRMSGVYTREAANGELQAVAAHERKGQLKMSFDPNTRLISIKPVQGGAQTLNLYVLLRAAGRTDAEIEKAWGKGIVEANRAQYSEQRAKTQVMSIAKSVAKPGELATTPVEAARIIMRHLKEFTFDTRITNDILGKPYTELNEDALLATGTQLVGISRGEVAPSSYDNIGHKKFLGPDALLQDYVNRKGAQIQRRVKNKVDREDKVESIVKANTLGREITRFFREGGETRLSAEANQTNPAAFVAGHLMTTTKGMGGISSGPGMELGTAQAVHSSHIGFLDPVDTGEKMDSGLALSMSLGARPIGDRLHAMLYNMKTGKMEAVDPLTADRSVVAFPDDFELKGGKMRALKPKVRVALPGGKFEEVPVSKVEYVIPSGQQQFGLGPNMVPFLGNNNGNRVMMASKMQQQAMGLVHREAPLVQIMTPGEDGKTFEEVVGGSQAARAPADGVVQSITPDFIKIRAGKGVESVPLYDKFPTNDKKGFLQHTPIVQVGDKVVKGQVIADLNFTKGGTLALGTNLRWAYVPMKGYNFEDGVVISQSAAEKLTSEHLYKHEEEATVSIGTKVSPREMNDMEPGAVIISKAMYMSWGGATARAGATSLEKIDENGVIKVGSVVEKGDILVAAVKRRQIDDTLLAIKKSTRFNAPWAPKELRWDSDHKGKVSRVVVAGKKVTVYVYTQERMGVGDKLVGRYGNKGIITKVLEDHEMPYSIDPKTKEKVHVEVAVHPAGVPGRINPGQLLEMGASKIAEKTGSTYKIKAFNPNVKDTTRALLKELAQHGLSDEELLIDPESEKPMGSVITGKQYTQKLVHVVDKKLTTRGGGPAIPGLDSYAYDLNNQPVDGYPSGGQSMGALGIYSLLGHNARANLRDMQTHRSTYERATKPGEYDSDDYWLALMNGFPLPSPQPTFAVRKFEAHLKAMGVAPRRNANEIQLVPMTDADVLKECSFEIKEPNKFIDAKAGKPEKGGLFDLPEGQVSSTRWGHIKLKKPVINPVYEEAIATLVGVSPRDIGDVARGIKPLPSGKTGMDALIAEVDKVNPQKDFDELRSKLESMPASDRDKAYKKLKLLRALIKMNLTPRRAYTMSVMPVLPPVMRPVGLSSMAGSMGDVETVDINHLYRQVGITNKVVGEIPKEATEKSKNEMTGELYDAVRRAYVEGAVNNRGAPISSLLQSVTNPKSADGNRQGKYGYFQAKLIKRRLDLTGRSVITPEPSLNLDQVGIPRKMALQIYRPFIIREMRSNGYAPREAIEKLRSNPKDPVVQSALERVISTRPLLVKRDPALHKFSIMAFYPIIHEGKNMQIHPMVVGGFNADFDGDTMAVFVPSSDEAAAEARRMTPSNNLFSEKGFTLMNTPAWDYSYGIWQMTEMRKETSKSFGSPIDVLAAHKQDVIQTNDVVKLRGKPTTAGRVALVNAMPQELQAKYAEDVLYGPNLTKKALESLLSKIAKAHPGLYPKLADSWKNIGADNAYRDAWSFGLKDYASLGHIRDKHLAAADKKLASIKGATDADKIRVYAEAKVKIEAELRETLDKSDNRLWRMTVKSGVMGSKFNQVEQMISSPIQVVDLEGKVAPDPVRRAYSEGLSSADYWTTIPGVRAGTLSRAKGTSEPGAKAKGLINLAISLVVTEKDCGTRTGVKLPVTSPDIESRYLATETKAGAQTYARNTLVDTQIMGELRKHLKVVEVRSTIECRLLNGVCQMCSGVTANGRNYEIGDNVGVNSAQSLSEPMTQMAMNAFHTGGSASGGGGSKTKDQFTRLSQLFELPKTLKDSATISRVAGSVKSIQPDREAGGFFVQIGDDTHRVPRGHELLVKVGDKVEPGAALCDGPVNPHELLEYAGMDKVRDYLVTELHDVYGASGVRVRNVETIVRQMTSCVEVISDPEFEFTPGEVIARTRALKINEERAEDKLPPIRTKPVLKDVDSTVQVMAEGDFLAAMNYQELQKVLRNAAVYGSKSDMHGTNPIPGLVYGAEFGKGKDGRY